MRKFFYLFWVSSLLIISVAYSQPVERYGFENGTQGWVASDYQFGRAVSNVTQSSDRAVVGAYSLKAMVDLIGGSSTNASGEAYVDMRNNPPLGVITPINLQGQTLTAYIYCPVGSRGDVTAPNGIQILLKDENWKSLYSKWINIVENSWIKLTLTINDTCDFDSTKVIVVGFKIGAGLGSSARYNGPIYLDTVSFDVGGTPPMPSAENQRYDFETGIQGWADSNYTYGQAVVSVEQSSERAALGASCLRSNADLAGGDTHKSYGEAYVDMRYSPPSGVTAPLSLNGVEVSAWIYCPAGSRGDGNNPNGVQIFVKDENWKAEYSSWTSIFENVWFKITLTPCLSAPLNGSMDEGFDPARIINIGVKIGTAAGSTALYKGPVYFDVLSFSQPSVPLSDYTYDFGSAGALNGIPRWDVDSGWGALAWDSVYLSEEALTASAKFSMTSDKERKGFVNIFYAPPIYLTNKDNHIIRAEVKFDPQPGPLDFIGVIWVYDKEGERWYRNDYKNIGGGAGWSVLSFDLDDNMAYDPDLGFGETMPLGQIVKVGIQLYANADYTGRVYFDNITIGGREITSKYPQNNTGLVERSGTNFVLGGQKFYFAGANAEYLFEKSVPIEEKVLDSAKDMNLGVVRTWAFGEGEDASFQPIRGKFNQSAFEHLDRLIAYAGKKGIRLMSPLVDNWGHYGGMYKYMDWALAEHPESVPDYDDKGNFVDKINKNDAFHDQFFVNQYCKQWYKDYASYLLNRTNSITGVRYKDDPNIFAWEVFNEPRCGSDVSGKRVHDWIVEMSNFVKTIDPNHLVGTGEEGAYIMAKDQADQFSGWQDYPYNYWIYGLTQGSSGVDFLSDHKTTDTTVFWQDYEWGEKEIIGPIHSELREGALNVDFCSFRAYIDASEFNLYRVDPYDQSLKWIEQHMNDAFNVIGKPVIMEEFGIHTVGYIYGGGFGERKFHRRPAYTVSDRMNIFQKYYDYIYDNNIAGSLFWNLGYDGMRADLFDGCETLAHSVSSTWAIDSNSDAAAISLSEINVIQGEKSFKLDYANPLAGRAFYDLPNLTEKWEVTAANPPSSGAINRAKFTFDLYNAGDAKYVDLAVCAGPNLTWHESTLQPLNTGWNKVTVDLSSETWKSAVTDWSYAGDIADLDDVRKISIGLFGYSAPGSAYVDNINILEDDGFVIYPGDEITNIISAHARMMADKFEDLPVVDTTPPAIPIVTTEKASLPGSRTEYSIKAKWESFDSESGVAQYLFAIGTSKGSNDVQDWNLCKANVTKITTVDLDLAIFSGKTYYFTVKAKNGADLWSEPGYSEGIIFVDTTPPPAVNCSIKINDNAQYAASTVATLTLSAADAPGGSGMGTGSQMKISNTNPADWTAITTVVYATTKSWTLTTGSGTKTVYVKFKDAAGNWSNAVSDTIILDTTLPAVPVVTDDGTYTTSTTQLHASWSSSDPESGIIEYKYGIGASKGAADVVSWTNTTSTSVTGTGLSLQYGKTYYFTVHAKNGAFVWNGPGYSDGITINDITPPSISHTPIASAPKNKPVTFTATVTDSTSGVKEVTLYWRKWIRRIFWWEWSDLRPLLMSPQGNNKYSAILMASQVEDRKIKYYITAKDKANNARSTSTYVISRY
ncbi:MAG: hypothetical protein V1933_05750 [Candidatus Omnitrophota bacterium]